MQTGIEAYRKVAVSTMDRGTLLLALYEGAIGFLNQALAALEQGNFERFAHFLGRGTDIIGELMSSLDREAAPRLAGWLGRIYDFMLFELSDANLNRSAGPIRHVMRLLGRIYDSYRQVIINPSAEVREILAIPVTATR